MLGLILIGLGLFALFMTARTIRGAEDYYYAFGWKVNMKTYKTIWLVASLLFILCGTLQIVGVLKIK
jgi:hypothetical protein